MRIDETEDSYPQSAPEIMVSVLDDITIFINDEAVMAGGTRWRIEILPDNPRDSIEFPLLVFRRENVPMLALHINIIGWNVGLKVALGTCIWLSGNFD
jgi:hypothetical protein